jgi:peroxiredoxin
LPSDLVLLSDFNREFGEAYDLLYTSSSGLKNVLRRCVLVIAPDGTLVYRWDVPEPPRLPTVDETLGALRAVAQLPS